MSTIFNYALKPLSEDKIYEYFNRINHKFPKEYIAEFINGNKFNSRGWYFFPIKDSNNIKKTALDIIEANDRFNDDDFYIIAENKEDAYLAFSKDETDEVLYIIDTDENTVSFLSNNFKEFIVTMNNRFPNKVTEKQIITDFNIKINNNDWIYFIYDPENDFPVFVQSLEYYPSAVALFWLEEDAAKKVRDEKFADLDIKKIKKNEFKRVYLSILDEEEQLVGLDWNINDDGLEIIPADLM